MSSHLTRLSDARTVATPAATMRTLISPQLAPSFPIAVWRTEIPAGTSGPTHTVDVDHFVTVVEGSVDVTVDGRSYTVTAGDGVRLPANSVRTIRASDDGDAVTLSAGMPGGRAQVADNDPVAVPWTA